MSWIVKFPLCIVKPKQELETHNPRLMSAIFTADVFHTNPEVSSIIFDLRWEFFVDAKILELERLGV